MFTDFTAAANTSISDSDHSSVPENVHFVQLYYEFSAQSLIYNTCQLLAGILMLANVNELQYFEACLLTQV